MPTGPSEAGVLHRPTGGNPCVQRPSHGGPRGAMQNILLRKGAASPVTTARNARHSSRFIPRDRWSPQQGCSIALPHAPPPLDWQATAHSTCPQAPPCPSQGQLTNRGGSLAKASEPSRTGARAAAWTGSSSLAHSREAKPNSPRKEVNQGFPGTIEPLLRACARCPPRCVPRQGNSPRRLVPPEDAKRAARATPQQRRLSLPPRRKSARAPAWPARSHAHHAPGLSTTTCAACPPRLPRQGRVPTKGG